MELLSEFMPALFPSAGPCVYSPHLCPRGRGLLCSYCSRTSPGLQLWGRWPSKNTVKQFYPQLQSLVQAHFWILRCPRFIFKLKKKNHKKTKTRVIFKRHTLMVWLCLIQPDL